MSFKHSYGGYVSTKVIEFSHFFQLVYVLQFCSAVPNKISKHFQIVFQVPDLQNSLSVKSCNDGWPAEQEIMVSVMNINSSDIYIININ